MNNDPTSDLAYRFEYADGSAFEIYADGRAFLDLCERGKEEKFGKIDNRIPALIGTAAKPRQDRIDELLAKNAQLSEMAMSEALANSRLDEANEELRKQLVKCRSDLEEYGQHTVHCDYDRPSDPTCTCGFTKALVSALTDDLQKGE